MQHAIVDYVSRLDLGESVDGVKEDFLDWSLFNIEAAEASEGNQELNDK